MQNEDNPRPINPCIVQIEKLNIPKKIKKKKKEKNKKKKEQKFRKKN
jgi:hypothetical protein